MIFLDELKDMFLYKRQFYIPINEKDKRHNSAIFLLSPNVNTSIKMMNMPYVINRRLFESYYVEKDLTFILNPSGTISERVQNMQDLDIFNEETLSTEERKSLPKSDFGLPEKRKYPMPDEKHVLSAIRFFNYVDKEDEKELADNIIKKIEKFKMKDISIGDDNRLNKYILNTVKEYFLEASREDVDYKEEAHKLFNEFINNEQIKPEYNKSDSMSDIWLDEAFWSRLARFIEKNRRSRTFLRVAKSKILKQKEKMLKDEEDHRDNNYKRVRFIDFVDKQVEKIDKWTGDYYKDKNKKNVKEDAILSGSEYIYEDSYIFNNGYLKTNIEGSHTVTFFNEENTSYNSVLRKLLYSERIKNDKSLLTIYKSIKQKDPKIKRTYLDYKYYKDRNLFVDLSYYNSLFLKNNYYKIDRAVNLYFDFIDRLISNNKLSNYTKKTIFIPLFGWRIKSGTSILDHKENINPLSTIYRTLKLDPNKLNVLPDCDIVILGEKGYFKSNIRTLASTSPIKFKILVERLLSKEEIEEDPNLSPSNTDSPKAIVANIVDKIETSKKVTINNLTGKSTISKEEIDKKINSSISASDIDKENQKNDLVNSIKYVADKSTTTDDAIEALDNDYIKNILINLETEEDNKVKVNAARASRLNQLQDEFLQKQIKNVSIKDLLDPTKNEAKELPSSNLKENLDTINPEWEDMKFVNFEKTYNLDRDIISILNSFSTKSAPIGIRNITVEDATTSEDSVETYTIECEDSNGKRFTIKMDIPKIKNNRFMKLRGNDKVFSGQLVLLPVIKTDHDTVQIVSNYKKIFVRRYGTTTGKSYIVTDKIIKSLNKYDGKDIKIIRGDNSKICAKYELPIDYIDLATEFTRLETKNHIIYFNPEEIRKLYKDKIDDKYGIPIAYDKTNNGIVYFNNGPSCSNQIRFLLDRGSDGKFAEFYDKASTSTKYTYSKASILNAELPVVVMLGYNIGLTETLNRAAIEYKIIDKRPTKSDEFDVIKFKDGYLQYRLNYNSSLLMNGLKECDTEDYELSQINSKAMWLDFLEVFENRIISDGLDNFYDLMIDPITAEVCRRYNLPDNYVDILIYANNLLADNKYNRHTDLTGNRYRTNEIIAGYTYTSLCKAYEQYRAKLRHGQKDAKMTMKQSAVIDSIMLDPTMSDLSILNPLLEVESANSASFKGLAGMNADRAYGLDKRTYDKSMLNLLALSTGFAANVGITRQTTIDMNIEGDRGYIKTTDNTDDLNITKSFSMTEALTPFGTTHDDPFRSAMTFIQTSKHGMRVKNSMPMLITNGADEALPYMSSDTFAFKAKENGIVKEKTDEYMVVEYKSGKREFIDLRETVKKNSDGGFFITIKLDSDYKEGQKIKANDIIAYDKLSYSNNVSPNDNLAYNVGTLAKTAIMNTDEGFEDSAIISEWLSDAMSSEVVVKIEKIIPKSSNVYNMVKKGQQIQEGDSLMVLQNAFDDNDMNILLKNLSGDEQDITDLARIPIRSKITGVIQDINIYRTVEKDELSESLKKIVDEYEKDVKKTKKVMDKYKIEGSNEFTADYKLDPVGKLKNAADSVLIEFYLKYDDKMSVGDKLVYYSALKGVTKDLFPEGEEPYSSFRPDEKIHTLLAIGSVNGRMVTSVKTVAGINKVLIELDRAVKDIMEVPYNYLDEM